MDDLIANRLLVGDWRRLFTGATPYYDNSLSIFRSEGKLEEIAAHFFSPILLFRGNLYVERGRDLIDVDKKTEMGIEEKIFEYYKVPPDDRSYSYERTKTPFHRSGHTCRIQSVIANDTVYFLESGVIFDVIRGVEVAQYDLHGNDYIGSAAYHNGKFFIAVGPSIIDIETDREVGNFDTDVVSMIPFEGELYIHCKGWKICLLGRKRPIVEHSCMHEFRYDGSSLYAICIEHNEKGTSSEAVNLVNPDKIVSKIIHIPDCREVARYQGRYLSSVCTIDGNMFDGDNKGRIYNTDSKELIFDVNSQPKEPTEDRDTPRHVWLLQDRMSEPFI